MDFTEIFKGESLTLEQFNERTADMKLADLTSGEYVAKGKYDSDIKKERDKAKEAAETIKQLQDSMGDVDGMKAKLEEYQKADEARQKAEQEAAEHAALVERFNGVKGDREFSSEYAESGLLDAFNKAISDPANVGKGDKELFEDLTKDAAGLFKNPQQETVKVAGVDMHTGAKYTADQIRAMTPEQINANWADVSASLKGLK